MRRQSTIPMEIWIDDRGRMRRQSMEQKIQNQTMNYTVELFDFGARESIKAPPVSETKDMTELAAKAKPQP